MCTVLLMLIFNIIKSDDSDKKVNVLILVFAPDTKKEAHVIYFCEHIDLYVCIHKNRPTISKKVKILSTSKIEARADYIFALIFTFL